MAFSPQSLARAREAMSRYPFAKSALLPLLHIAQEQDGWVSPEAMREIASLLAIEPAQVLGVCSFYSMFKCERVVGLVVSVCTNVTCYVNGGPELLESLRVRYATDDEVEVEEVECLAACDLAPVCQVNYEFHGPMTPESAVSLVDDYESGARKARTISGTRAG